MIYDVNKSRSEAECFMRRWSLCTLYYINESYITNNITKRRWRNYKNCLVAYPSNKCSLVGEEVFVKNGEICQFLN